MLPLEGLKVEMMFTLPKPLANLFCHLVNVVFEGRVGRGGRACKDFIYLLSLSPSCFIPNLSSIPAVMIATEQKELQVMHLGLLAPVHHLCTPFCFHCLGPALDARFHSVSINRRSAKHIPIVLESGILKKESIVSPKVTNVGSRDLPTVIIILHTLTRVQPITAIMIPSENSILHPSFVISLLHWLTSTTSPPLRVTSQG